MAGDSGSKRFQLSYASIRNSSSPADAAADRKVLHGQAGFQALIDAWRGAGGFGAGVRSGNPALGDALRARPRDFSFIHGGLALGASEAEIDDKARVATLHGPVPISGSETMSEILAWWEESGGAEGPLGQENALLSFELLVSRDSSLLSEAAAARADGAAARLFDSAAALVPVVDGVHPVLLLRLLATMAPRGLWAFDEADGMPDRSFAYGSPYRCVALWQSVRDGDSPKSRALARYADAFVPMAAELYRTWKSSPALLASNPGWNGAVPDGVVFPVLAALSCFLVEADGGWKLSGERSIPDAGLAMAALALLDHVAGGDAAAMGSLRAAYATLEGMVQGFIAASA